MFSRAIFFVVISNLGWIEGSKRMLNRSKGESSASLISNRSITAHLEPDEVDEDLQCILC